MLVPARTHELLDLFDDEIEAPLAVHRLSHGVVHFGAAVQREDDVLHLLVEEFDGLVVKKEAIGRRREEETLAELCGRLIGLFCADGNAGFAGDDDQGADDTPSGGDTGTTPEA